MGGQRSWNFYLTHSSENYINGVILILCFPLVLLDFSLFFLSLGLYIQVEKVWRTKSTFHFHRICFWAVIIPSYQDQDASFHPERQLRPHPLFQYLG